MVKTVCKRETSKDLMSLDGKMCELYNMFHSVRNMLPKKEALEKFRFEGKNIEDLAKAIIDYLNQKLLEFSKEYIAGILILMTISENSNYQGIVSKLKPLFYQNLPLLLSYAIGLLKIEHPKEKQITQKRSLRVILQIITDLHCNNKKRMAKILKNDLIELICQLPVLHDPIIMSPMMRILSQALKFGNKSQKERIALKMYEALLFDEFPDKLVHVIIFTCKTILGAKLISEQEYHGKIVNNLKKKLMKSLECKEALLHEKYIGSFIYECGKEQFEPSEIIKMIKLANENSFSQTRISFIQNAIKFLLVKNQNQTEIFEFFCENDKDTNLLQILTFIIPILLPESFLQLLQLRIVEKIAISIKEEKKEERNVIKIETIKKLIEKSKQINESVWAYLQAVWGHLLEASYTPCTIYYY